MLAKKVDLLREAVSAARNNNKVSARQLLQQACVQDPNNEQVWLWRASLAETPAEATAHLERVLEIDPTQKTALSWLSRLRGDGPRTAGSTQPAATNAPPPASSPIARPPVGQANPAAAPSRNETTQGSASWLSAMRTATSKSATIGVTPPPVAATPAPIAPGPVLVPPKPHATPAPSPLVRSLAVDPALAKAREAAKPAPETTAPVEPAAPPVPWECPLCGHLGSGKPSKCPNCKAVVDLADIDAMTRNREANEHLLRLGIARLERQGEEFAGHVYRAMAYLNLHQSGEAVQHLKAALQLSPNDAQAKTQLEQLMKRKLVLIVDDSPTVRKLVMATLERSGYRTVEAVDGMEAMAKLNDNLPNLILLDITMPRMGGYQVCKILRENTLTKKIPVLLLSGNDGFFDKVKGRLAGATDYLTKPFEPTLLVNAISKYV